MMVDLDSDLDSLSPEMQHVIAKLIRKWAAADLEVFRRNEEEQIRRLVTDSARKALARNDVSANERKAIESSLKQFGWFFSHGAGTVACLGSIQTVIEIMELAAPGTRAAREKSLENRRARRNRFVQALKAIERENGVLKPQKRREKLAEKLGIRGCRPTRPSTCGKSVEFSDRISDILSECH